MRRNTNYDAYAWRELIGTYCSLGRASAAIMRQGRTLSLPRGNVVLIRGRERGSRALRHLPDMIADNETRPKHEPTRVPIGPRTRQGGL